MKYVILLTSLISIGCNKSPDNTDHVQPDFVVQSYKDLPQCDITQNNKWAVVFELQKVLVCDANAWGFTQ